MTVPTRLEQRTQGHIQENMTLHAVWVYECVCAHVCAYERIVCMSACVSVCDRQGFLSVYLFVWLCVCIGMW